MTLEAKRFALRLATPRDAESLAQIFDYTWNASYRGILPLAAFEQTQEEGWAGYWHQLLLRSPENTFVLTAVDEDDDPVGLASTGPDRFGSPNRAEIYALYVMPGYQGLGLGRRLLRDSFRRMHEAGYRAGLVWVLAEHISRDFYERMGGTPAQQRISIEWGHLVRQESYVWPNLGASFADTARPEPARSAESG